MPMKIKITTTCILIIWDFDYICSSNKESVLLITVLQSPGVYYKGRGLLMCENESPQQAPVHLFGVFYLLIAEAQGTRHHALIERLSNSNL